MRGFPYKSEIAFWNAKSYVNGDFSRIRLFHMAPENDRHALCDPRSLSATRMGPEPTMISRFSCHFCVVDFGKSEKRWSLRRRRTNVPPLDHGQSFLKIDKTSIYSMSFRAPQARAQNRKMTPFDPPFEQKSIWEFLAPREQRGPPTLFFRGSGPLFTSGPRSFQ